MCILNPSYYGHKKIVFQEEVQGNLVNKRGKQSIFSLLQLKLDHAPPPGALEVGQVPAGVARADNLLWLWLWLWLRFICHRLVKFFWIN